MGLTKKVVELKAGGPNDPNGERAASVLAAYFNAAETRTFRRLLWRRLVLGAVAAWLIEAATPLLPRAGLLIVLLACAVVGATAAIAEWRAHKALMTQLADCPGGIARTFDATA
jgi:hypothetical protein